MYIWGKGCLGFPDLWSGRKYLWNWYFKGCLGFSDLWSGRKPLWNWYLTPVVNFGEVRKVQLAKSTILTSALVPLDLFRSFTVCSDAKEIVRCWKQGESTAPIQSLVKLQPWFLSLQWKTCLCAQQQPRFLGLQWRTYPWVEHSWYIYIYIYIQLHMWCSG